MANSRRREPSAPAFLARQLFEVWGLPPDTCFAVALSGGRDSATLFAAAHAVLAPGRLRALHVHHGLHDEADAWALHCQQLSDLVGRPCVVSRVTVGHQAGQGLEAAARSARFRAFETLLGENEVLLVAHHADDRVETVWLQSLRGTGLAGLAGMPERRALGRGLLGRPWLRVTGEQVARWAAALDVSWVNDPSNADRRLRRNYLRHEVLGRLVARWPAASLTWGRLADHAAQALALLSEYGESDLARIRSGPDVLDLTGIGEWSDGRLGWVVKTWLQEAHVGAQAHQIAAVVGLARGHGAHVSVPPIDIRRYRARLYRIAEPPPQMDGPPVMWSLKTPLDVPALGWRLVPEETPGRGLDPCITHVRVGSRASGARLWLGAGRHHQRLKTLFQSAGIPPWLRERLPYFYVGDTLAAVSDLWVSGEYAVGPGATGISIRVEPLPISVAIVSGSAL